MYSVVIFQGRYAVWCNAPGRVGLVCQYPAWDYAAAKAHADSLSGRAA